VEGGVRDRCSGWQRCRWWGRGGQWWCCGRGIGGGDPSGSRPLDLGGWGFDRREITRFAGIGVRGETDDVVVVVIVAEVVVVIVDVVAAAVVVIGKGQRLGSLSAYHYVAE
jgi:hypothetical protein